MTTQSIAFDRAANYYDATRGFPLGVEHEAAAAIIRAGKLTHSSRVIEIGIGTGRIALPLAKRVGEMHGLDLSRPMMLRLRAKQTDEPIYLAQGDATRLPYADHSFDAVVAVHVFHLIPNWQGVISELARVLKPNAPVIHCWSESDEEFKMLWEAWRSAVPNDEAADVGLRWNRNEGALEEIGWRTGETETYRYSYGRSPAAFVRQLENRIWSATWRASDDSLAQGVAAVKSVVNKHYAHPENDIVINERFIAKAYTFGR